MINRFFTVFCEQKCTIFYRRCREVNEGHRLNFLLLYKVNGTTQSPLNIRLSTIKEGDPILKMNIIDYNLEIGDKETRRETETGEV